MEDMYLRLKLLNISEGGLLLHQIPHLPINESVPLMFLIPKFPYFKNFSLEKLKTFDRGILPSKVIRLKGRLIRREGATTSVDDVFKTRIGLQFTEAEPWVQTLVADYVSIFSSNIIQLQKLIEDSSSFADAKYSVRILAEILGYKSNMKISELRQVVGHDYRSLQWL